MKILKIGLTYDEIKFMSKNSFKNFIKKRTKEAAFEYLNILKKKTVKWSLLNMLPLKYNPIFQQMTVKKP